MEFISNYYQKVLPDKDYMYIVLFTLYQEQVYDVVNSAFKKRSVDNKTPKGHMIEMASQALNMIN